MELSGSNIKKFLYIFKNGNHKKLFIFEEIQLSYILGNSFASSTIEKASYSSGNGSF